MNSSHEEITTTLQTLHDDHDSQNDHSNFNVNDSRHSLATKHTNCQKDFVDNLATNITNKNTTTYTTKKHSDQTNPTDSPSGQDSQPSGDCTVTGPSITNSIITTISKTSSLRRNPIATRKYNVNGPRSVIDLFKIDHYHHLKIYIFGTIISILSMIPLYILLVPLEAHYCDGKDNSLEDEATHFVFNSVNHIWITLANIYGNFIVCLSISWFVPSILCLYQIHWNKIRILCFLYLWIIIVLISYYFYLYLSQITGMYLIVCWMIFVSLFVVIGFIYGYPAFRALLPFVFVFTLIMVTFSVGYSLIFTPMPDNYFSLIYPWYLCLVETLALYIIDGFLGTLCQYIKQ